MLIHGHTDSARDWVPMLPYLSKNYRLILVDIREHGRSSNSEYCYSRLDFAYDIKRLLVALAVQRGDFIGHSWGSKDPIMWGPVRQSLRGALPHAEVRIFDGLGHNSFWEDSEGVARVINAFLDARP